MRVSFKDGGSAIVSHRATGRAKLEFEVLKRLRAHGALVPDVLAYDGKYIIQEDLGAKQFNRVIRRVEPDECEELVNIALLSMAKTNRAARKAGLKNYVATLGEGEDWRLKVTNRPRLLGEFLNLPIPDFPVSKIVERLRVVDYEFVKWDARPPNAIYLADGNVAWIDWEHCGRRNSLDDLVWWFCDQSMSELPDMELRLLKRHVPAIARGWDEEDAHDYLAVYGTLHLCMRLTFVLQGQRNRGLKDWSSVSSGDKEAASALRSARKLSARATRWSARSPLTAALTPWLQEVTDQMVEAQPTKTATAENNVVENAVV
jgi:hypothetical protein